APFVLSFYAGALVPILLVAGALRRPGVWFWWLTGGAAFFWIAAAGSRGPAGALSHIPPFTMIRYPEKLGIAALFLVTIAAAAVLDRLIRDAASRPTAVRVAASLFLCSLVALGATLLPSWPALFEAIFPQGSSQPAEGAALLGAALGGYAARAAIALAVVSLLSSGWKRSAIVAALAFAAADLSLQSLELCPRKPASFVTEAPEIVQSLPPDRAAWRLFHMAEWSTASPSARMHYADPATRVWITRNGLFPRLAANWGVRSVFDTDIDQTQLLRTAELTEAMWKVRDRSNRYIEHFSAMSNARWVALFSREEARVLGPGDDPSRARPVDLVDLGDNPRYFLASGIVEAPDVAAFVERVSERESVRGIAFVERDAFAPAGGLVESIEESANRARVSVNTGGEALLVASVTAHKYWKATVDGAPAPIRQVNVAYQGVVVPEGRHIVEFRYRNPLVAAGLGVSALALLLAQLAILRRRPKRSEPEPDSAG
ncbi:MAG: YfhO family protein, partial [Thermoanaerobaculia bacterium]